MLLMLAIVPSAFSTLSEHSLKPVLRGSIASDKRVHAQNGADCESEIVEQSTTKLLSLVKQDRALQFDFINAIQTSNSLAEGAMALAVRLLDSLVLLRISSVEPYVCILA